MKTTKEEKLLSLVRKVERLRAKNSLTGLSFIELIEFQNAKAALKRAEKQV